MTPDEATNQRPGLSRALLTMFDKIKPYVGSIVLTLVVIAVVFRFMPVRKVITGS